MFVLASHPYRILGISTHSVNFILTSIFFLKRLINKEFDFINDCHCNCFLAYCLVCYHPVSLFCFFFVSPIYSLTFYFSECDIVQFQFTRLVTSFCHIKLHFHAFTFIYGKFKQLLVMISLKNI